MNLIHWIIQDLGIENATLIGNYDWGILIIICWEIEAFSWGIHEKNVSKFQHMFRLFLSCRQ